MRFLTSVMVRHEREDVNYTLRLMGSRTLYTYRLRFFFRDCLAILLLVFLWVAPRAWRGLEET